MSATAAPPAPAGTTTPPPARDSAGPRPWKWTPEQYVRLHDLGIFEGRRVELIRGEIIDMGKQGWPHVMCVALVAEALRRIFAGVAWVNGQSPHPTEDSKPEPDVRVIPGTPRDYQDHPTTALLVVDVAESSLSYDLTTKAQLYAEAGVADYWVLDLVNRQLHVFRDPAPLPEELEAVAYRTRFTLGPADAVSPLAAEKAAVTVAELLP